MALECRNLIGGARATSADGRTFESRNPADPTDVIGVFPRSGAEDACRAIEAAAAAQEAWSRCPAPARGEVLLRAAETLRQRAPEIGGAIAREMGKPLREALAYETRATIDMATFVGGEGRRLLGETRPSEAENKFICVTREPVGVVSVITPWNLPLVTPAYKIFPALLCGNTVVFKPAEDTPFIGQLLHEVLIEAGLPPAVLNVVHGFGAEFGETLVTHPRVAMVSFTGSTPVGRSIGGAAGQSLKRVCLELGGKNAIVVLDDADLDLAVSEAIKGGYGSAGQRCTASSRIIVDGAIYDRFVARMKAAIAELKIGDPRHLDVQLGPVVNRRQRDRIHNYTLVGMHEGARLVTGGVPLDEYDGYFYAPTLFDAVTPEMRIAQEEIFGPVVCVLRAKDEEEAFRIANGTEFGLSLSVFTRDLGRAMRAVRRFESGLVYVNASTSGSEVQMPFGGRKQTGNGHREGGVASIEQYTELKSIFIHYPPQ